MSKGECSDPDQEPLSVEKSVIHIKVTPSTPRSVLCWAALSVQHGLQAVLHRSHSCRTNSDSFCWQLSLDTINDTTSMALPLCSEMFLREILSV